MSVSAVCFVKLVVRMEHLLGCWRMNLVVIIINTRCEVIHSWDYTGPRNADGREELSLRKHQHLFHIDFRMHEPSLSCPTAASPVENSGISIPFGKWAKTSDMHACMQSESLYPL